MADKEKTVVKDRLIVGALLVLLGLALLAWTEGVGIALGVICLVAAAYQLISAAVANGIREGRG